MTLGWDGQDDLLRHARLCERINNRARADGWDAPGALARIILVGTPDDGLYTVVVGAHHAGPFRVGEIDEDALYAVYTRLLAEAGIPRSEPTERTEP